jgi:hypothetical protein
MSHASNAARHHEFWQNTALQTIRHYAASGKVFEAYDLTREGLPEPTSPSQWGALMSVAHRAGLIEPVGAGPSLRPTVKGSLTRYWRGTNVKRNAA